MREFSGVRAVDGISFALSPGEQLTVFGPNGAGKTTLLALLAGSLLPSSGEVCWGGEVRKGGDLAWFGRVGVLSHQGFLYGHLTALENLRFHAELHLLDHPAERARAALVSVGLEDRRDDAARTFSRGMRQRLALARTLLHDPRLILLDEPYTGLDAHAAGLLRSILHRLRDGERTLVLVTHNLSQGLEQADQVAIQVRGRFAVLAPPADLPIESFERFYRETVESAEAVAR